MFQTLKICNSNLKLGISYWNFTIICLWEVEELVQSFDHFSSSFLRIKKHINMKVNSCLENTWWLHLLCHLVINWKTQLIMLFISQRMLSSMISITIRFRSRGLTNIKSHLITHVLCSFRVERLCTSRMEKQCFVVVNSWSLSLFL